MSFAVMRTHQSFEWEGDFQALDASTVGSLGENEQGDLDWGVVSHSGSDLDVLSRRMSGNASVNTDFGIVVLDSAEGSNHDRSSVLSIPGSESLPTYIGSVSVAASSGNERNVTTDQKESHSWLVSRRLVHIGVVGIALLVPLVAGLFVHQRNTYRSSIEELAQKILLLEKEQAAKNNPPIWAEEGSKASKLFTILDNCWIKAKMNIRAGECLGNSEWKKWLDGCFFSGSGTGGKNWFTEVFTTGSETSHGGDAWEALGFDTLGEKISTVPSTLGEALFSAGETFSDRMHSLNAQDSLGRLAEASDAASEALQSAWGKAKSKVKGLMEDPSKYQFVDVKGKTGKLSRAGNKFWETTGKFTEALVQTGEAFSAHFVGIVDEALSLLPQEADIQADKTKEKTGK